MEDDQKSPKLRTMHLKSLTKRGISKRTIPRMVGKDVNILTQR